MSGNRVLLDSVILIDHLAGVSAATRYLRSSRLEPHVSAITRAEVLAGYDDESVPAIAALLDRFPLLPIDRAVADLGAALRRAHGWKLPDALQVAAARVHGLDLATRNTRDFPPDRFLFVQVPYQT